MDYPNALIGVHTGASGIVVLDIDRKDARDGFETIESQWLGEEWKDTFRYDTQNNGAHYIYSAPEGIRLNGQKDYRKWTGIDRKGGSSYVIWYGGAPESRDAFAPAPEWLCDPAADRTGSSFEGGLDAYLGQLEPGEPTERVLKAVEDIPSTDFGHDVLVGLQYRLVRLGAEGQPGVRDALEILRDEWLRGPYDTSDYRFEYDLALSGAIAKAGAEDAEISNLPSYIETLEELPDTVDLDMLVGAPAQKSHYFTVARTLARTELSESQIATLIWNSPRTRQLAREWGIQYLYEAITKARAAISSDTTLKENPNTGETPKTYALLTDKERALVSDYSMFTDRYLEWASTKVNIVNAPYHLANALTILSNTVAATAFIDVEVELMNCNLFIIALGPSSTGKSQAISLRRRVLNAYYAGDLGYNLGADASIQYLQKTLLSRDGKVSFFNSDEAHGVFLQLQEQKFTVGLVQKITDWYGGFVSPMGRVSDKSPDAGKEAHTVFNMNMFGVESELTDVLTEDMFKSGFLARVLWFVGEDSVKDESRYIERRGTGIRTSDDSDGAAEAFATELALCSRGRGGRRVAVDATDEALTRMTKNREAMDILLAGHPNRAIIDPSLRRLGDNISKVSALLAMGEGLLVVELPHVLKAIEMAETWLVNLVNISGQITASTFQRDCDIIEAYINSHGGSQPENLLYNRFRNMGKGDYRDFESRLVSLKMQGRLKMVEGNEKRSTKWESNTQEKEE